MSLAFGMVALLLVLPPQSYADELDTPQKFFTEFSESENEKRVIIMYDSSIKISDIGELEIMSIQTEKMFHIIPRVVATITLEHLEQLKFKENIVVPKQAYGSLKIDHDEQSSLK